jgi:NAD(P)-dependent dehydrogenase (short-subunit alcohol dehydrogenase family)
MKMHSGARVLVTAAASGIGAAIARAFLRAGARVHICDLNRRALGEALDVGEGMTGTLADVSDPGAVDALFDEAQAALDGLDVLVNNAGIAGPTAPLEEISVDAWRRTLAVGLDGAFFCARRAVPLLKRAGGGCIVNISSTSGVMGCPNRSPYVAAKWALIGLTKTWAMELGDCGIRVNAICPGVVEGERLRRVISADAVATGKTEEQVRASYQAGMSLHTLIEADDVAAAVLFLCSPGAARISGQALGVDGHTETQRV